MFPLKNFRSGADSEYSMGLKIAGLVALLKPAWAWNLLRMPENLRQQLVLVKY